MAVEKIKVEVFNKLDDFYSCRNEWNAVGASLDYPSLHMSHEWLCCWWESFGENSDALCLLLSDINGPFAVASFVASNFRLAGVTVPTLRSMGNDLAPRASVLASRRQTESWQAIWPVLLKRKWTFFDHGKSSSPSIQQPYTSARYTFAPVLREQLSVPIVRVSQDWDQWLGEKPRKFRKKLRQAFRDSKDFRVWALDFQSSDLKSFNEDIESIVSHSWSHSEGSSFIGKSDEKNFFSNLFKTFSPGGRLLAVILYDETVPIAFAFGVSQGNRMFGLKTSYREDYANSSAGSRVMAEFVKNCIATHGIELLDMDCVTSHGEYKKLWGDYFETAVTHRIFRYRPASIVLWIIYRLRKYANGFRPSKKTNTQTTTP